MILEKYFCFMHDDTHQTILSSLSRFFSGTLISRMTGLGREVIMAAAFGTSPLVASFWMAFRFAHLLRRLFGEGALHVAFVPHFEELKAKNTTIAAHFFYHLSKKIFFLLLGLTLLIETILGLTWGLGSLSKGTLEVLKLTMILLPSVIFICLHALNSSLLQCEKSFFLPSVSPVILNVMWMGSVLLFWNAPPWVALQWLSWILVLGFALQWLFTLKPAYAFLKDHLREEKENFTSSLFALMKPFLLGMLGVAATQVNNGLDALFAKVADPEGPAILWYALRLQQLPLALLGVGISGALLPPISRAIQKGDLKKAEDFLHFSLKKIATYLIPTTFAIFALGYASVNLVYGRGEFNEYSLVQTTHSLWAYSVGLLPMTATFVFAAAYFAMKNYKTPSLLSIYSMVMNVFLNAFFVYWLHLGSISIAYATSIAAFFNAISLWILLKKKLPVNMKGMSLHLLKVALASCMALSITLFFFHDAAHSRGFMKQLILFTEQCALFFTTFLFFAYLLKLHEFFKFLPRMSKFERL